MQSILNDLFLARDERALSKRLQKADEQKTMDEAAETLQKALNDEQLKLFLAYEENVGRRLADTQYSAYRAGLRDGATFIMEIFYPLNEPLL